MTPLPPRVRWSRARVLAICAFFCLAVEAAGPSVNSQKDKGATPPCCPAAPDFELSDTRGRPITLAAARGKVVLVNFWAIWCDPCQQEIPGLIALQTKYKDGVQIIGLSIDDDLNAVQKLVEQTGINYPVAIAPEAVRKLYGGIPAVPTCFFLSPEGKVMGKHVGINDFSTYESEIRKLLGLT